MRKLLIFLLIFSACISVNAYSQNQEKVVKWLKNASSTEKAQYWFNLSSELNKLVPINVDSETLLFNTAPLNNGLTYNYKLTNYAYEDMTKNQWNDKISNIAKESVRRFCTTPDSLLFREANADIKINYYDRAGSYIGDISFNAGKNCD